MIQDSDEELEDDLEVVVRQPEMIDVPPKQSTGDASSTGKDEVRAGLRWLIKLIQRLYEDR